MAIVGDLGGFVHGEADAVSNVIFDDAEVATTKNGFDGVSDVAKVNTWPNLTDAGPEGGFGGLDHLFDGGAGLANVGGEGGVGVVALVFDDEVKGDLVAILEGNIGVGCTMDEFVVDGDADCARERRVKFIIGGLGAAGDDFATDPRIEFTFGHTNINIVAEVGEKLA